MTIEKAIEVLKTECYVFNPMNFDRTTLINTALDTVIETLEQEPCEDAISRKELTKALDFLYEDGFVKDTRARRTLEVIMGQASVAPQPKTGHWIFDKEREEEK